MGIEKLVCLPGLVLYGATAAFYWMSSECRRRRRVTRRLKDSREEKGSCQIVTILLRFGRLSLQKVTVL